MCCHACDVAVGDGQRFCHECGTPLTGVTDATAQHDVVPTAAGDSAEDSSETPAASDDAVTIERAPSAATVTPSDLFPTSDAEPADDVFAMPPVAADPGVSVPDHVVLPPTEAVETIPSAEPDEPETADESEPLAEPETIVVADVAAETVAPDVSWPSTPANPLDSVPWATDEPEVLTPTSAESILSTPTSDTVGNATPPRGTPPIVENATTQMPVTPGPLFDGAHEVEEYPAPPPDGFKLRASFVFAFLAVLTTLMSSIADVVDLRTSIPIDGIDPGIRNLEEFGTNLAVGGFLGAALMLIGGLAACFGARWGAGLAGGSGLAVTGWSALTLGLVERPIFEAQMITRNATSSVSGFTLTVTRDIGWFLILGAGALGVLVFLVSLRQAGTGGRPGLDPWIAAIGGLGSVVLAAGPLIPLGAATLDSNLGFSTEPTVFFVGRLVQLSLLVITGVLGFLSVRTYGLGLAAGGLSVSIWLWATTLAGFGSGPIGPALGNLGSVDTSPHAVTGVGVAVSVLMLAISVTIAVVRRPRHA